tara:strand:- start:300 stop:590 length:291 start_codon:yes stop_codon:yes gene_type:complete
MDNLKIPIVLVVALGAQLVGAVFWGSNILRDISDNTAKTEELLQVLWETEEALEEVDDEIWSDVDNLTGLVTEMIKLQARVAILEKTVEFTRKDGM